MLNLNYFRLRLPSNLLFEILVHYRKESMNSPLKLLRIPYFLYCLNFGSQYTSAVSNLSVCILKTKLRLRPDSHAERAQFIGRVEASSGRRSA